MTVNHRISAFLSIFLALVVAGRLAAGENIPGWPTYDYKVFQGGLDRVTVHGGKASYRMWANSSPLISLAGVVSQYFRADTYRGKRIRFSTYLKTESAEGLSLSLHLLGRSEQFADTVVSGTTAWKRYEHVLDVPEDCVAIKIGFWIMKGTVWMDDGVVEIVDRSVPITTARSWPSVRTDEEYGRLVKTYECSRFQPVNLDFEGRSGPVAPRIEPPAHCQAVEIAP